MEPDVPENPWKFVNHDHPQFPARYRHRCADGDVVVQKQHPIDGDWQEILGAEKRLVLLVASLRAQLFEAQLAARKQVGAP